MGNFIATLFLSSIFISCSAQSDSSKTKKTKASLLCAHYYSKNNNDSLASTSSGTEANGTLSNAALMPPVGDNFYYFSDQSYLAGRAYTNSKVKKSVLAMYASLAKIYPNRIFQLMECSNEHGGKIWPHHTHQNGLSVDFMMPLTKDSLPYYKLDDLGKEHYLLSFDNDGCYSNNKNVKIDFDIVAKQILILDEKARKNGLKIKKVIIKIELKDELFATPNGKKLKARGIYVVKALTPLINGLHDDHFHIDFEKI
jgi:penicillin-insensitive murein endopeptidase